MVKIVVWDLPLPVSPLFKAIQMAPVSAAPATAPREWRESSEWLPVKWLSVTVPLILPWNRRQTAVDRMNPPTILSYSLGDKMMKTVVQLELPPPFGPKVQSSETPHKLPQSTIIRKYANMVRIGVHSVANSKSVRLICCCCQLQTPLKLPISPPPNYPSRPPTLCCDLPGHLTRALATQASCPHASRPTCCNLQ